MCFHREGTPSRRYFSGPRVNTIEVRAEEATRVRISGYKFPITILQCCSSLRNKNKNGDISRGTGTTRAYNLIIPQLPVVVFLHSQRFRLVLCCALYSDERVESQR